MPERPTLVIFDFDNTLVDSRIDYTGLRTALADMLAEAGAPPESREALLRLPLIELVERGAALSPALAGRMWTRIEVAEADGLRGAGAMPYAREVLAGLRQRGFRLALLTNNARAGTTAALAALDLASLLDHAVTRDDVPRLKPDPSGVRLVLERAGPVRAAYLVGDSWIDGRAAEAAGVRFVGFGPRRADAEARGLRPWAWVTDLRELLDLAWEA
ncbi:MAG: HAD-IA family hydrolase [Armatimonadota bacterium]|nr:HAD-IA family hydrolase [Armatimonadota bacterium]